MPPPARRTILNSSRFPVQGLLVLVSPMLLLLFNLSQSLGVSECYLPVSLDYWGFVIEKLAEHEWSLRCNTFTGSAERCGRNQFFTSYLKR
jgi:hypothetical protein